MFGLHKKEFNGHGFRTDKTIKAAMLQWFQQQPRGFPVDGIKQLMHQ
jgi:hypothetical protein